MEYKTNGERHSLELDKDELITLIAAIHEGLENIEAKSRDGNQLAIMKYESTRKFVSELNMKIMSV